MEKYSTFEKRFDIVYDSLKKNIKSLDDYCSMFGSLKQGMVMPELAALNKLLAKTNSKLERMAAKFRENIGRRAI